MAVTLSTKTDDNSISLASLAASLATIADAMTNLQRNVVPPTDSNGSHGANSDTTADPTPSVTSQEPGAETVTVVSATSASGSGEVGATSAPAPAQVNLAPVQVNPAPAQVNAPSLSSATTANMTTVATTTPTVVPPVQAHANAVAATTLPVPASGSFERWYVVTKGLVPGVYNGWHNVHPLVSGVSGACHQKHPSEAAAKAAFREAWLKGDVAMLT